MNPVYNPFAPFAPGAGTPPPELAGRTKLREQLMLALVACTFSARNSACLASLESG